jgi:hypothetical protein
MRKLTVVLIGLLVILSMVGPVYAKSVTSSSGGIGTSHTGAGVGSFEKMAGAGHSAFVQFSMMDSISGDGATSEGSLSDSGTDADEFSTVAYTGTITWDALVKGGDGTVDFSTGLLAQADEMGSGPDGFWVWTEIWSDVKASANEDAEAKGEVTSRGTASATSVWDLGDGRSGSITSVSSGRTSASAEVEEYSSGGAFSDLEGYTEVASNGYYGILEADIEAGGYINQGTGEVESSASGMVTGTGQAQLSGDSILAADPALSYNGMAVAEGTASGSLEAEEACGCYDNDYYTEIDVGSPEETAPAQSMPDFAGAHIFAVGSLGSDDNDYDASVEAGAEGSGLLTESYGGWDRMWSSVTLDSVSGSASVEADQKGSGWIGGLFAGLYSFDDAMPIMYDYPAWVAEPPYIGIVDWETMILFDEFFDDSAFIGSRAEIETWGGSGSADAAASGKVVSSSTNAGGYRVSNQNNIVEGSTKADVSSGGYGYGAGDSLMLSRSSIGPEIDNTGMWVTRDEFFGYDLIGLMWRTYAGTGAQISSHSEAYGAATSVSSSAQGTVVGGASGLYIYPGDPAYILDFNSAANAAGKVSSEAKSRTEDAAAESTSLLLATNAVGDELSWLDQSGSSTDVGAEFYFDDLYPFVGSHHALLTSAAVWSPEYTGTSTATAKAAGTANSAGDLLFVEDWPADPDEAWVVSSSSSGAGTLASDFKAKNGYGISKAWVHGGNFAGFNYYDGDPEIQSFDAPDWLAGIHTLTYGEAPEVGSLKGTASIKEGSSMEMASISYEEQDLLNPEEWNELYTLDTYSRVTDKASAEVSVKKGGGGMAGSFVTAMNNAWLDYPMMGSVDADYYADAYADSWGTGKAKAQIKPWTIVTSAEYTMTDTSVFPPGLYHDEILYLDSGAESAKSP